jgi:hypothetical protein
VLRGLALSSCLCEDKQCTAVAVVLFDIIDLIDRTAVIMGFCTVMDLQ